MASDSGNTTEQLNFQFTQDWSSGHIPKWISFFPLVTSPAPRALEIGSWEGRSAVFLLNNLCKETGELVCIDHFDLRATPAGRERFAKVQHNLGLTGKRFRIIEEFSVPGLTKLLGEEMTAENAGFDWIYVDGSHEADDVMLDAELSWRLARKGAVIIFDDYRWPEQPEDSIHHPKRGIDAFLALHRDEFKVVSSDGDYQIAIQKLTEMRIGFLNSEVGAGLDQALCYGVHVALTVDSSYVMGAAVAMRSASDHTPGRITFYVVDCGLTSADREHLLESVVDRNDVTMNFVALREECLARELGPVWAKLDLADILPVERVLYLDADTLVLSNLKELWGTDLDGKTIGAVFDVGHPMGHPTFPERRPYFNAGVLLLDLTKIRYADTIKLADIGKQMKGSEYKDQDALNTYFRDWKILNLSWNAQGLGTYANYRTADRDMLRLDDMRQPKIVHFTGPVHPPVGVVLNPYVQPPTAKPWGYAGSPGHPFAEEWWRISQRTWWKESYGELQAVNRVEMEKAITSARQETEQKALAFWANNAIVNQMNGSSVGK